MAHTSLLHEDTQFETLITVRRYFMQIQTQYFGLLAKNRAGHEKTEKKAVLLPHALEAEVWDGRRTSSWNTLTSFLPSVLTSTWFLTVFTLSALCNMFCLMSPPPAFRDPSGSRDLQTFAAATTHSAAIFSHQWMTKRALCSCETLLRSRSPTAPPVLLTHVAAGRSLSRQQQVECRLRMRSLGADGRCCCFCCYCSCRPCCLDWTL